jgi:hypothetical protein
MTDEQNPEETTTEATEPEGQLKLEFTGHGNYSTICLNQSLAFIPFGPEWAE